MVDLIPREILFGNPERVSPGISPDGTRLAWVAAHEGVLNVWVAPISPAPAGDPDAAGVDWAAATVVTNDRDRGVSSFIWSQDGQHILYLQDTGGDENWRVHDVNLVTLERRDLTPFENVQAELIASEPSFPTELLVGLNRDNPELHDVYRLDLVSGSLTKELDNPGLLGLVADSSLVVRAGMAPQPDGGLALMVRDGAESEWRQLLSVPADDALTTSALSFSLDGASLLITSSVEREAAALLRVELATGETKVLAADDLGDVTSVLIHPVTKEPQIASILKERHHYEVIDPSVTEDLDTIRSLHGGDPSFLDTDNADDTWLVGFTSDAGPVSYYSYDRPTRQGSFLFEHQPALSAYELSAMEPFAFTARDGLEINGYVTFPVDSSRHGLPTVFNVHGGPWARDVWGYDPTAQWLANRGYLCVQVNFRGSSGYGKTFLNAGDKEWGGRMHDDLVDAVAHAVSLGWADPAKVAIFGGSYGGYAALVGATFTPDLFCCAVDIVGPSNLETLIATIPPYWAPLIAQFHRRVGNPETEADFLWSRSPLSRVKDIRVPLLIAQGANDPRVNQAESEQVVSALSEAGIDHEYMLFPDEGHGFAKPENRLRFAAAAETFLARHLGGRAEA
ncbi:MAG: S9 family peptidase [Acidimicrobiales bacterium]